MMHFLIFVVLILRHYRFPALLGIFLNFVKFVHLK